jgi:hypothetical protein
LRGFVMRRRTAIEVLDFGYDPALDAAALPERAARPSFLRGKLHLRERSAAIAAPPWKAAITCDHTYKNRENSA